ncbi:DUF6934 family protein [Elizabethkingia anophelis]|uniref:DUF6934 family protein n=1 Tax=Elizabethkingia anophelis TaxID=1117645 RepID=UPI00041B2845|nr:hypothetical protein [Elizabethkingia anophelis]
MDKLKLADEIYNYEQVDSNPSSTKYEFISVGEKEIPKRVHLMQYHHPGLTQYYNLGFGNIYIDDEGIENVSDMSRDNNRSDANKVLKTTLMCTVDFLSDNKDSIVTFYGNTKAKQRLYKKSINLNLEEIQEVLVVKGGIINNITIVENQETEKTNLNPIDPNDIMFENYAISDSNKYNIITFELKDEFK